MNTPTILADERAFLSALESAGSTIRGRSCSCPFHDDNNPSAQWSQGNDGTWRMYCHPCDKYANVLDLQAHMSGRSVTDLYREASGPSAGVSRPYQTSPARVDRVEEDYRVLGDKQGVMAYARARGDIERWYVYGPKGAPALVVARIVKDTGKKSFLQFTPLPGGKYAPKNLIPEGQIPLYRADELGDRVLIVEGEKCADAAWAIGVPATTSAMGAGKAKYSDWSTMRGRTCYLWPDNDDLGRKHMAEVKTILEGFEARVYLISIDGMSMPIKGDVADFIAVLDSKTNAEIADAINGIMDDAAPQSGSHELAGLFDDIDAGKYKAIPWPELNLVGHLSKALLPGCITTLCADPGAGKSLLMLQMTMRWHQDGIPIALLMLEDERRIHLQRVLAQLCRLSSVTDDEWCRSNSQRVRELIAACKADIDGISARIKAEGEDQLTLDQIAEWIQARCAAGARIVVVDPVTAATTTKEPWAADTAFLMKVKKIARDSGSSVILTTHPRGQAKGAALGGMAGGSAYPRFSHAALWLEKFEMAERYAVDGTVVTCNRSIKITKSRHGQGGGQTVGILFDPGTLRFRAVDVIAPDEKPRPVLMHKSKPDGKKMNSDPTPDEDRFANIT